MTTVPSTSISSFGVVAEAENQILISEHEKARAAKTSIKTKKESLEQQRQERIDNLQERLKMMASSHGGCLKFLKVITLVASVISTPFTAGASASLATAVSAILSAVGGIVTGLEQLKEAMKQKNLLLNQAEGQQILAIITETKKWIEDEQNLLQEASQSQRESLEEYKFMLSELEESFSTMNDT